MCATTSTSVGAELGAGRCDQRAPDRPPGGSRAGPGARAAQSTAAGGLEQRARADGAAGRARRARGAAPRGRRACRRRARARARRRPQRRAGRAREAGVARERALAERRRHHVGGVSSSAFVPVPVAVGDDHDRRGRARAARSTSSGSSAGQSPGTSSTRSAPRASAASIAARAAADWPASTGSCTTWTPAFRASRGARLGGHHDHAVELRDGGERVEHVGDHRRGERGTVRERRRPAAAWRGRRT